MPRVHQQFLRWSRFAGFVAMGAMIIASSQSFATEPEHIKAVAFHHDNAPQSQIPSVDVISEQDIKATVQKFYDALSNPGDTTLEALNRFMEEDWHSTPTPAGGKGTVGLFKSLQFFNTLIPDLDWEVQEMLVDGNRVIVRSIASGTPNGNFFGVATNGSKSFKIMTIDIHTVENGKLTTAFHVEDWAGAVRQVSGD